MIKKGMFVRCPVDNENKKLPREFAMGKIKDIDSISESAKVAFLDVNGVSLFHGKPQDCDMSLAKLIRCKARKGAIATYKKNQFTICASELNKQDEYRYYYVKDIDGKIDYICEKELTISYNDSVVNPLTQMKTYEFQNPVWFLGRNVVSKTMNYIENSLYGFKDIAGCKIYLKPHQLKTIMRCLQAPECRFMLADEVGLGKTIEAISVIKIYINENKNKNIGIFVPDALIEQWQNELAFKFKLFVGGNVGNNNIDLIPISSMAQYVNVAYDFVIIDEVHKCLKNQDVYNEILSISKKTTNILMLSATPLQRRDMEFLQLLRLIQPKKYENISTEDFSILLSQQNKITRKVFNALDELGALKEALNENNNTKDEETEEIFEAVIDEINGVSKLINDNQFKQLIDDIHYEDEACGINSMQNAIAYVCENFQLEKSIIRNRRQKVYANEEEVEASRKILDLSYVANNDLNFDEWNTYLMLSEFIENNSSLLDYNNQIIPLVNAFFSSASAFNSKLISLGENIKISSDLLEGAKRCLYKEKQEIDDEEKITNKENKISQIVNFLYDVELNKKVILFTDFGETFDLYKELLINTFGEERCCFFRQGMNQDELELNVYRFQTDDDYQFLLSDSSGGEGRNFQNADFLIHIDIPWNANDIEQRIGRLDRIGRDASKDVTSVVVYAKETLEEDLFNLWEDGLHLFTKAQSGLEIIMGDIEDSLLNCLKKSFKYGLIQAKEELGNLISSQLESLKKEQVYDIAAYQFKDINRMLDDTIEKYTKNETTLFGDAMMGWASLSGFNGAVENDNVVSFSQSSISFKSLNNTLFMPPNLKVIIDNKLNQLRNRVRTLNNEKTKFNDNSYIRGTFNRQKALKNDYLNFFAPGDDIFDSITDNALQSYKGTCCSFSCNSNISWRGFVFIWKYEINDIDIYANRQNEHIMNQYKGYLPGEEIITIFDDSDSGLEDDVVISEFLENIRTEKKAKIKHLGRREGSNSPMIQFIKAYPPQKWHLLVDIAYKTAKTKAISKSEFKKNTLLNSLYHELISSLSAQKAAAIYFDEESNFEIIKEQDNLIYKMIKNANIVLDSVCYVVMKNEK